MNVSNAQTVLLESGLAWQHRNDVQIPSKTGTGLSFDEADSGPFFHYRAEVHVDINSDHGLRFIYAPLSIEVKSTTNSSINYNSVTFDANQPITINYTFNSYRLGYTYSLYRSGDNYFKIGLTGKIRQAEIKFTQGSKVSSYDNVGFVPLLYYGFLYNFTKDWSFFTDADFAAAPQGRAIDMTLKIRRNLSKQSAISIGIRGLEGGADNDKVKTFSFITYAVADFVYSF